ncbi:DUF47 family protein [Georgenia yuyongxinii]|uniref:DUF47 family protein n=1 Tax=Georgenia yuyongxinii TaxID=2589797 RepID=A0A5B8C5P6_9MICO|nr:DUF47 family protein [Georgenia yuyongxinii]QDC26039.1 DUF47 family protein [Georgenia yuyongxinii]
MRFRFRPAPRGVHFFDLYTESAAHLRTGADLLARILGADLPTRAKLAARLKDAEHAADEAAHQVYTALAQTFVTPFDRDDMYHLASALDDCMDAMDEAGELVVLYQLGTLPSGVSEQVAVLRQCAELTYDAMPRLRSFDGLEAYWIDINRLENQADRVYRRVLADLMNNAEDAITVIKVKGVVDALEEAADSFERLANHVQTIVLKES